MTVKEIDVQGGLGNIEADGSFRLIVASTVTFRAFLCPHCPNTHFDVIIPGADAAIMIKMSALKAEEIADMLLNPQPAPQTEFRPYKK